jgi:hypothetical protein
MKFPVYIRHKVGWCPVCGAPILDAGWTDDPNGWVHAMPLYEVLPITPAAGIQSSTVPPCAMALSI